MKLPEQAFPSTHDGVARVHNIFSRPVSRAKVTTKKEEWDSRKSLFFFCFVLN